ncbi:MAG: GNAT family N-acetyltransferase [Gammaproteobacteria bacterium]|nr:GNAT family N-acetyltransferase [Gammaproteobacteria bacterium]
MKLDIQRVPLDFIYPLRSKVLRPGQAISSCHYPEDKQADAFHLAALDSGNVIGIASFYHEAHPDLDGNKAYRLRGMAVEPEMQSYGIGSKLLSQAFDICNKAGADLLWCNARTAAMNFYLKLGFKATGEPFELAGIGEHYLMHREL